MRYPLINVKYATDQYNFLRRLNHRYQIGKLNTRAERILEDKRLCINIGSSKYNWKPFCNYFCNICIPIKVKTKLFNSHPARVLYKKQFCLNSVYEINKIHYE